MANEPQTGKLTRKQFADWLKSQDPDLRSFSDDDLVNGVLKRRPDLASRLAEEKPPEVKERMAPGYTFGKEVARGMGFDPERIERYGQGRIVPESLETLKQFLNMAGPFIGRVAKDPFRITDPFEAVAGGLERGGGRVWKSLTEDPASFENIKNAFGEFMGATALALGGAEKGEPFRRAGALPYTLPRDVIKGTVETAKAAPAATSRALLGAGAKEVARAGEEAERAAVKPAELARRKAEIGYIDKLREAREAAREQIGKTGRQRVAESRVAGQRRSFEDLKDRLSEQFAENLDKTERARRTSLDQRYAEFRKGTRGAQADITPLTKAVDSARQNLLKGSATSVPIFNDIMSRIKEAEGETGEAMPMEGANLIDFGHLRGYVTELGERMYGAELPGDVYRALKSVRETAQGMARDMIEDVMGKSSANSFDKLNSDWADYENTWRDRTSGSPLVAILDKIRKPITERMGVPAYREAGQILTRKSGEQAMRLLARERGFGADPNLAARLRAADRALKSVPTAKELGAPAEAGGPVRRVPGEPIARIETPEPPPAVLPEETRPARFEPVEFRRKRFLQAVERFKKFGWDDKTAIAGALYATVTGEPSAAAAALLYPLLKRAVGFGVDRPSIERMITGEKLQ